MSVEEFDPAAGEPERDRELGAILARFESSYATSQIAVARQRYRIGVASRRQQKERLLHRAPEWMEWTARAARPLPIGIAAALLITAASIIAWTPTTVENVASTSTTEVTSLTTLVADGGTSAQIMDALIAPTTADSLLAAAFASPLPARP